MNEDEIDQLLDQLKAEPVPDAPANLESRVLKTIRTSPDEVGSSDGVLPFPLMVTLRYAAVVAILAMGSGLIFGSAIARSSPENVKLAAREALSFDVFDVNATRLPYNLLEK